MGGVLGGNVLGNLFFILLSKHRRHRRLVVVTSILSPDFVLFGGPVQANNAFAAVR